MPSFQHLNDISKSTPSDPLHSIHWLQQVLEDGAHALVSAQHLQWNSALESIASFDSSISDVLRDGRVLYLLAYTLQERRACPVQDENVKQRVFQASVQRSLGKNSTFHCMERVQLFLHWCRELALLKEHLIFTSVQLLEEKNDQAVCGCLDALRSQFAMDIKNESIETLADDGNSAAIDCETREESIIDDVQVDSESELVKECDQEKEGSMNPSPALSPSTSKLAAFLAQVPMTYPDQDATRLGNDDIHSVDSKSDIPPCSISDNGDDRVATPSELTIPVSIESTDCTEAHDQEFTELSAAEARQESAPEPNSSDAPKTMENASVNKINALKEQLDKAEEFYQANIQSLRKELNDLHFLRMEREKEIERQAIEIQSLQKENANIVYKLSVSQENEDAARYAARIAFSARDEAEGKLQLQNRV